MYICVNGSVMLWPQCLHDWIWYFSRGCRQCWRSLGMRDHRAFWPRGCMFSSLVWVQRSGPSHPWLFLKVHCVTNHSRQPPTHKLENDNPRDSCPSLECAVKMEGFYFHCTLEGAVIASALSVGDWVAEDMSGSCQSASQSLYLCEPRPEGIMLPSAGNLSDTTDTVTACKWRSRNDSSKLTFIQDDG